MKTKTIWVTRDKNVSFYELWRKRPHYIDGTWYVYQGLIKQVCYGILEKITGIKLKGGPRSIKKITLKIE